MMNLRSCSCEWLLPKTRVEGVAQGVPEKVEGHYGQSEEKAWVHEQHRVSLHLIPRFKNHASPTRIRRGYAQTQKREGRFRQNHARHILRHLHNQGTQHIGKYVLPK